MQAITVKCPECNGVLKIGDGNATVMTCSYCGAEARIQRRTQFLQRAQELPPVKADEPNAVMVQVPNAGRKVAFGLFVGLVVPTLVIAALVLVVFKVKSSAVSWGAHSPVVVDVDGDGTEDIVGTARYVQDGDSIKLAAWNGKTGDRIWETDTLGNFDELGGAAVVSVGKVVLHDDKSAGLHGFDLATGKSLWNVKAGENVRHWCATDTPDATVDFQTADQQWHTLAVATGAIAAGPAHDKVCAPARNSDSDDGFTGELKESHRIKIEGMQADRILISGDLRDGGRLAVGYKSPGTNIPMLAMLDENNATLWKIEVPVSDPMKAATGAPDLATFTATHVFACYEMRDHDQKPVVVAFDRATGKRLWHATLPSEAWVLSGIGVAKDYVAVGTWTPLFAYDLATGKQRWAIGD